VKVRIGVLTFPIGHARPGDLDESDYGIFHDDHGIGVAPALSPDAMASTIMHEIIHAIWHTYKLPETVDEESAARLLEGPMLAFLFDNPALIAQLRAAVRGKLLPV
jgi:Zn-dependent peptidase ImmA (M78 family)